MLALLNHPGQVVAATTPSTTSLGLAWNANPESDIASYQVYYGTTAGSHPTVVQAGADTTATVTGLVEGTTYYFVVSATNQAGLQSVPSAEISYQPPVTTVSTGSVIPRDGWTLLYVDSAETNGYPATNAFDGDSSTFWHSNFTAPTATLLPHEIQVDMGTAHLIEGFHYLPRQDNYMTGNVLQYEFYASMDGANWGAPAASGVFANTKTEKEVLFTSMSARYVRLKIITAVDSVCAVAELNVLQGAVSQTPAAVTLADWAAAANLTVSNSDPLAIPHHDGVANLLKYAFGMNGSGPDVTVLTPGTGAAGLPIIALDRSGATPMLRIEFLRRKNSLLVYTPRKSLDLQTWQPLTSTPVSVTDLDTEWERVVLAEPCDPSKPAGFGRVEVALTSP